MDSKYDVIVIGAGHAGCEAAAAATNLGSKICLTIMDMNKVAQMSCDPAVGGIAKGQIIREIDALGGYMGLVTDRTAIQFRILNRSKGPAMWSPRTQCDRNKFTWTWCEILESIPNLYIWQDIVKGITVENGEAVRLKTFWDVTSHAKRIVSTAGTFLNGLMHVGRTKLPDGHMVESASYELIEPTTKHGVEYGRMKTGIPVRIDERSVYYEPVDTQDGEYDFHKFSFMDTSVWHLKQLQCWMCSTNEEIHDILRNSLSDSPLFNRQIQSIRPCYCPSIGTKIVIFSDKEQHQLFLEPEGETTQELYLNGFPSSLLMDIQMRALKKTPAFRGLVIYRLGYAIEYDYFDPTQLKHTLESKKIRNLFFAGQVNGTTGYEEAGGQGIIAGINAYINCHGGESFTLARDGAYIGILIDDLVTRGADESHRMLTSRAEYRILLRIDDADMRLTGRAYKLGLVKEDRYVLLKSKHEAVESIVNFARNYSAKAALINDALGESGIIPLRHGCKLINLINRPQTTIENILEHIPAFKRELGKITDKRKDEIPEAIRIPIKYEGYIGRERTIVDKLARLESTKIKGKFDYDSPQSLSIEARQKPKRISPETVAQASRIPGVSPSDINVLLVLFGRQGACVSRETKHLKKRYKAVIMSKEKPKKNIRKIPDFPTLGILFYGVTTLFKDSERLRELPDTMHEMYKDKGTTKVVSIESWSFIMGPILVTHLGAGFIPIRKPGKLPAETMEEGYDKEYGGDTVQIHRDALNESDIVLLHDDLLATGGTMKVVYNLVKKLHPKRAYIGFIIELKELSGKKVFGNDKDVEVQSVLSL